MSIELKLVFSGPYGEGGIDVFNQSIDTLTERLSDWTPFFEKASDILELHTAEQFASHGASGGTPWAPLAESTIARRERAQESGREKLKGHGRTKRQGRSLFKIGTKGGRWGGLNEQVLSGGPLEESFRDGGEGHVKDITPESLVWGSEMIVSRTGVCLPVLHHYGSSYHLPSRPILVKTEEMLNQLGVEFIGYAQTVAEETGWGGEGIGGEQLGFSMGGLSE